MIWNILFWVGLVGLLILNQAFVPRGQYRAGVRGLIAALAVSASTQIAAIDGAATVGTASVLLAISFILFVWECHKDEQRQKGPRVPMTQERRDYLMKHATYLAQSQAASELRQIREERRRH